MWLYGGNTILKWVLTMSKPKKKVIAKTYLDALPEKGQDFLSYKVVAFLRHKHSLRKYKQPQRWINSFLNLLYWYYINFSKLSSAWQFPQSKYSAIIIRCYSLCRITFQVSPLGVNACFTQLFQEELIPWMIIGRKQMERTRNAFLRGSSTCMDVTKDQKVKGDSFFN